MPSTPPTEAPPLPQLQGRYLLVMLAPFLRTPDGKIWLDDLLARDIEAHVAYLPRLRILAPMRLADVAPPNAVPAPAGAEFAPLFTEGGAKHILRQLPQSISRAWAEVGAADYVHSGVAGWPFPPGIYVNPIAVMRGKPLIIIVESAFWRLASEHTGFRKIAAQLRRAFNESFARWSLRKAKVAIYTHDGYRDSLPPGPKTTALVLPASWIRAEDVLSAQDAQAAWDRKPLPARFLLASRLTAQKGIPEMIAVIRALEARGERVAIDIMGEGDMKPELEALVTACRTVQLRVLPPTPYGAPFLEALRGYHAALVPTAGDEQPRIIYDALSQAVPVIASDTAGNRQIVSDGRNGFLRPLDRADDFAQGLIDSSAAPERLREMGLAGHATAMSYTQREMHMRRALLLGGLFGGKVAQG